MLPKTAVAAAFSLTLMAGTAAAKPKLERSYWKTNRSNMYFERTGQEVYAEYLLDSGVINGTLSGDTLRGYWRESSSPQACGPDNKWSGRVALLWDSTGKAFTGDWNDCEDAGELDLKSSRWTGTYRATGCIPMRKAAQPAVPGATQSAACREAMPASPKRKTSSKAPSGE